MICIACQWSGEAIGVLSPKPITTLRPILAKLLGQRHAGFERIEQPAIRQIERDPHLHAERLGGRFGFGQPHFRARRARRRLAVGQVDDADLVALPHELGERAAAGDFHVVGMGADGDHVEFGPGVGGASWEVRFGGQEWILRPPSTGRQTPVMKSFSRKCMTAWATCCGVPSRFDERAGDGGGRVLRRADPREHYGAGLDAIHADPRVAGGAAQPRRSASVCRSRPWRGSRRRSSDMAARRPNRRRSRCCRRFLRNHLQPRVLAAEEGRERVHFEIVPHVGCGDCFKRLRLPDGGGVDERVEPAELFHD